LQKCDETSSNQEEIKALISAGLLVEEDFNEIEFLYSNESEPESDFINVVFIIT